MSDHQKRPESDHVGPKRALWSISVWGINVFGGDCCDFVDEECVYVEKARQIPLMGSSKWLPSPITERTPLVLTIRMPIHFIFNKDKRLQIIEGKAPYGISTDKRITRRLLKEHQPVVCKPNPITIAMKYQEIYNDSDYQSLEKVAQQFGVSRVRIYQILNLLKLDQRIVVHIKNITDPKENNFWTERRLRRIKKLPPEKQYQAFKELIKNLFKDVP